MKLHLESITAILTLIWLLVPIGVNFSPQILQHVLPATNLSGTWRVCKASQSEVPPSECSWDNIPIPGKVSLASTKIRVMVLEKRFDTPKACILDNIGCQLFLGTLSDSAEVYLNNVHLGGVGEPPPKNQYAQTYPGRFFSPAAAFNQDSENVLVVKMYPGSEFVHGLIRGPIGFYSAKNAGILTESMVAGTVFLPLFSAFALVTIGAMTALFIRPKLNGQGALVAYCAVASTYLVSLSRIPRHYLPQPFGCALHFSMRFLLELTFVTLVLAMVGRWKKIQVAFFVFYTSIAFICLTLPYIHHDGHYLMHAFSRVVVLIFPSTALLAIIGSYLENKRGPRFADVPFFSAVLIMQCWDACALRGLLPDIYFGRFSPMLIGVYYGYRLWKKKAIIAMELEASAQKGQMASQVAHDIRSPLAALEMVSSDLKTDNESHRVILRASVQRIQDIANTLLNAQRHVLVKETHPNISESVLVSSLIENIVTEKRMQFRARLGIIISAKSGQSGYGLFVQADPIELKRVVSNLVNNAVEALKHTGRVEIAVTAEASDVVISVRDNGVGMPNEVLSRLGEKRATFGKNGGHGLGVFHAREALIRAGGSISYSSEVGAGTTCRISLPRVQAPHWFRTDLKMTPTTQILILDDDVSIHQIWQGRFRHLLAESAIHHFSTSKALLEFVSINSIDNAVYLIDYELIGEPINGIDTIMEIDVAAQATLVTSRFEDAALRKRCAEIGLKILPKEVAAYVPIQNLQDYAEVSKPISARKVVLLDDDSLVRKVWEISAEKAHVSVQAYATSDDFFTGLSQVARDTSIYIDSHLGDGERGELVAQEVAKRGFEEIFLATGFPATSFPELPWIKGIVGKEPPF